MLRGLLLIVLTAGCTDDPVGDLILTSHHDLVGYHYARDARPTAVGGSQTFELRYRADDVFPEPGDLFDRSFSVRVDKRIFRVEKKNGPYVTLTAVGAGVSTVEFVGDHGGEYFTTSLAADTVRGIAIRPEWDTSRALLPAERSPTSFAWWKAPYTLGVFVSAHPESVVTWTGAALVAENMEIQFPIGMVGQESVRVDPPAASSYPLSVTVGDETWTESFVVVDAIDSLALAKPAPAFAIPNALTELCYEPRASDRYVFGTPITYAFRGTPVTHTEIHQPCVYFATDATTGAVTVDATAGGMTLSTTVPVGF